MQIPGKNMNGLDNVELIVIGITLVFLIGAAFLLFYVNLYNERKKKHIEEKKKMQQQFTNQLLQSQVETQEETLSALGKELHDNIGQLLNSTKLLIGVTQRTMSDTPDTLRIANETLGTAINELRSLSKSLSKEWLQQFNLSENLETEVRRLNAADNLKVHFSSSGSIPLSSDQQIILFRIIQEALQNAVKHSTAKNVFMEILNTDDVLNISVTDDGSGMQHNGGSGVGMLNMQQRTALLGGSINWTSSTGGTKVIISLPHKTMAQ
jgi:signal transduction histidine kinase